MEPVIMARLDAWHLAGLLAVLAALGSAGCGGSELPLGRVTGRVTHQGKPLAGWIIYFVPARGPLASAPIGEEGRYTLSTRRPGDGAVIGTHKVYFAPPPPAAPAGSETEPVVEGPEVPPPSPYASLLPAKLLSPDTSGKTADVQAGTNQLDFDL